MKIAINKCFGGFSLSPHAVARYLSLKGEQCFFYEHTKYSFRDGADLHEKVELPDLKRSIFCPHSFTKDHGPSFTSFPNRADDGYFYYGDIKRSDPLLIQTIEELGPEACSGACAEIVVVEIPDGIDWEISEYDGMEHIAEAHQTWS